MSNISNLKDFKGEELFLEIGKIYEENEKSRESFLRKLIHTTNKKAFFTIDELGRVKRKEGNYILFSALYENDEKFLRYFQSQMDFSEQDSLKDDSLSRIQNIDTTTIKKNIIKLIVNGKIEYGIKYLYELYKRDGEEFFKFISEIVLMDNMDSEKSLYIYSMKEYFEKFGYSLEVFYFVMSYITKLRFDLYEYENICVDKNITKECLRERFNNNKEKYNNIQGLKVLGYLSLLEKYEYINEKKYMNILKERMDKVEKLENTEKLKDIKEVIFEILSK